MMFSKPDGPPLSIFTVHLFCIGRVRVNISFSTFGFAALFDEGHLQVILLCFFLVYRPKVTE